MCVCVYFFYKMSSRVDTEKKKTVKSNLHVESKNVKYTEAGNRTVVTRGRELGKMETHWAKGTEL